MVHEQSYTNVAGIGWTPFDHVYDWANSFTKTPEGNLVKKTDYEAYQKAQADEISRKTERDRQAQINAQNTADPTSPTNYAQMPESNTQTARNTLIIGGVLMATVTALILLTK